MHMISRFIAHFQQSSWIDKKEFEGFSIGCLDTLSFGNV